MPCPAPMRRLTDRRCANRPECCAFRRKGASMNESEPRPERATPHLPEITSHPTSTSQGPRPTSDLSVHRDLHQIIARAREEIHHLREQRTKMEADAAALIQERDDIAQRYAELEQHFLET